MTDLERAESFLRYPTDGISPDRRAHALAAEFENVRIDERTRLQRCTKCKAALDVAEPYCIHCKRPPGPR